MINLYLKRLSENGVKGVDFDYIWEYSLRSLMAYMWLPPFWFAQLDITDPRALKIFKAFTNRLFADIIDNTATSVFLS